MIHLSLTLTSSTEPPDREALASMLRMVANRIERPGWNGGTLLADNVSGRWDLTVVDLSVPAIDAAVAAAVAVKEQALLEALGPCAWCEEAQSPTYLAHEGHDPACPMAPR